MLLLFRYSRGLVFSLHYFVLMFYDTVVSACTVRGYSPHSPAVTTTENFDGGNRYPGPYSTQTTAVGKPVRLRLRTTCTCACVYANRSNAEMKKNKRERREQSVSCVVVVVSYFICVSLCRSYYTFIFNAPEERT